MIKKILKLTQKKMKIKNINKIQQQQVKLQIQMIGITDNTFNPIERMKKKLKIN